MSKLDSNALNRPTFAICYGFMEGTDHGKKLSRLLEKNGYRKAKKSSADIIIAHSAGCWLIPPDANPKIVVYIGMPLVMARPTKTWINASLTSLMHDPIIRNLNVRLKNTYDGMAHPIRNLQIMRQPKIAQPVIFPQAKSIFIANRYDPWPKGQYLDSLIENKPWAFIGMPGAHEHLWEEPKSYVAIIKKMYPVKNYDYDIFGI